MMQSARLQTEMAKVAAVTSQAVPTVPNQAAQVAVDAEQPRRSLGILQSITTVLANIATVGREVFAVIWQTKEMTVFAAVLARIALVGGNVLRILTPFGLIAGAFMLATTSVGKFLAQVVHLTMLFTNPIYAIFYATLKAVGLAFSLAAAAARLFVSTVLLVPRAIGATINALLALPRILINAITSLPRLIVGVIRGAIGLAVSAAKSLGMSIVNGIRNALAYVGNAIWSGLKAGLAFAGRAIINPGKTLIQPLVDGVSAGINLMGRPFSKLSDLLNGAANRFRALGSYMQSWSAEVTRPMTEAANAFAGLGVEVAGLSRDSGMSTKALTELGFAARQLGVGDTRAISQASQSATAIVNKAWGGDQEAQKPLDRIGLDAKKLAGMNADERFVAIADALSRIVDPAERAATATAIFGASGERLLDIFAGGEAGLARWREEAQRAGVVLDGPLVEAATALSRTLNLLKESIAGFWNQIGSVVAPIIADTTETIARAIQIATAWAKENREVIATVFRVASAVGTVGTVLATIGTVLGGAATVASVVAGAFGALATAVATIGGALAFVLSPVALVAAAVTGLAIAFGRSIPLARGLAFAADVGTRAWGSSRDALSSFGETALRIFARVQEFAVSTFGGIVDAIRGGNLQLAVEIALSGVQVAWLRGMQFLSSVTGETLGGILTLLSTGEFGAAADVATNAVMLAFSHAVDYIDSLWLGLRDTFDVVATYLEQVWNTITAKIQNVTISMLRGLQKTINSLWTGWDPTGKAKEAQDAFSAGINRAVGATGFSLTNDQQLADQNAALDQQRQKREQTRKEETETRATAREQERQQRRDANQVDTAVGGVKRDVGLAAKEAELARAIEEAKRLREDIGVRESQLGIKRGAAGFSTVEEQQRNLGTASKPIEVKREAVGSFSAAGLLAMSQGGGSNRIQEKMAKTAEEQKAIALKQLDQSMKLNQRLETIERGIQVA